jgi:hypothetical protein
MPALSDAVVIGIVLTLIFAAVTYYLYSRMVQSETKLGLLESILLNLKMATESSLFMSMSEAPPLPPRLRPSKVEVVEEDGDDGEDNQEMSKSEMQQMIDEAQVNVQSNIQDENQKAESIGEVESVSKVHIGFESMSWKELCAEAKKRSITGVSHMNRKKLIDILNKKDDGPAPSSSVSAASQQDMPEMVGTDLASIHDFPESGALLSE